MNKEDCKVGTLVRVRNGRSVGKIVEVNDETSTLSVAVVPLTGMTVRYGMNLDS